MNDFDITDHTIEHPTPDGRELITIHPEIDPTHGITDRYLVTLSKPAVSFTIEMDENGVWKCKDLPEGIDPDLVAWAGDSIDRYYK